MAHNLGNCSLHLSLVSVFVCVEMLNVALSKAGEWPDVIFTALKRNLIQNNSPKNEPTVIIYYFSY